VTKRAGGQIVLRRACFSLFFFLPPARVPCRFRRLLAPTAFSSPSTLLLFSLVPWLPFGVIDGAWRGRRGRKIDALRLGIRYSLQNANFMS